MSSRRKLETSLRRLKPEKHRHRLVPRGHDELMFLGQAELPLPKLLLDTTFYIDALQGRLAKDVQTIASGVSAWHCTVTEAELAALSGLLDPSRPETQTLIVEASAAIDNRSPQRILNPDREVWREAGILAGMLARLQEYGKQEHRRALNDALIYLTAAKHGCAVLTRNISDFDFLEQLEPRGRVLFYERV